MGGRFQKRRLVVPVLAAVTGGVAGAAIQSKYPLYEKLSAGSARLTERVGRFPPPIDEAIEPSGATVSTPTTPSVADTTLPALPYLSDKVFETTDDMLVFMFPSEAKFLEQASRVNKIVADFEARRKAAPGTLDKVKLYFAIVPPSNASTPIGDNVEIMCYKGQRKLRTSITPTDKAIPASEWEDFFTARSTPVDESLKDCVISHISASDFKTQVIEASSPSAPVLLQLYEKSCFLCFLMRPFLNTVAEILHGKVPITIKRLDIEENDFPEGLPVVRGTPTFVLFRGPGVAPVRFEEFKPRDLVKRICRDYHVAADVSEKLFDLVDRVALRFQSFSGLIMWSTEAEKILQLMADGASSAHNATIPFDLASSEEKEKELFNRFVSEFMSEDMEKCDGLDDNIKGLFKELNQMEKHAIMMGQVIGEKVVELEEKELQAA